MTGKILINVGQKIDSLKIINSFSFKTKGTSYGQWIILSFLFFLPAKGSISTLDICIVLQRFPDLNISLDNPLFCIRYDSF